MYVCMYACMYACMYVCLGAPGHFVTYFLPGASMTNICHKKVSAHAEALMGRGMTAKNHCAVKKAMSLIHLRFAVK